MMNCEQATRLASESQDRTLLVNEKLGLRLHLMMCVNCRRFNAQMGVLRQAMSRLADGSAPVHGDVLTAEKDPEP